MKIGFTGTQKGMTSLQRRSVGLLLSEYAIYDKYAPHEVHHGDCIGADTEFHDLAYGMGIRIVTHPPIKDVKRAFCIADETRPVQHYLVRNQNIVNETDLLIAAPKSNKEELRSGTWATIRYAMRKKGVEVRIVWPNGEVSTWNKGGEMDGKQTSQSR